MGKAAKGRKAAAQQSGAAHTDTAFAAELRRAAEQTEHDELQQRLAAAKNSKERNLIKLHARMLQVEAQRQVKQPAAILSTTASMLDALEEVESAAPARERRPVAPPPAKASAAAVQQFAALTADPTF